MLIQYGNINVVSRTALTTTANGNAITSNVQFVFGNASMRTTALGDFVKVDNVPSLNFGTNPFTFEFRYYSFANTASFPSMFNNFNLTDYTFNPNSWTIQERRTGTNNLQFWVHNFNNGVGLLTSNVAVSGNTWYSVAIQRHANNVFQMYIDGNLASSATYTGSLDGSNNRSIYFSQNGSAVFYNGYLDEIRISNTARYTTNYTPATQPFTNDTNTVLLLHCDGANGANLFPDDNINTIPAAGMTIDYANFSFVNRPAQTTTTNGNVFVSTIDPKIGNGSGSFGGATSITVDNANLVLNNSTEKTIEYWIKTSNSSVRVYLSMGNFANTATTSWWQLYNQSSNRLELGRSGAAVTVSPANTYFANGAWQHFAWTKNGANNSWYVNGNLIHTFTRTESDWVTSSNVMAFGAQNPTNQGLVGNFDEIRVSNVVRYTANFTPQTTAFTSDNNTQLLLHCDGANGTTSFPDDNIAFGSGGMTITYV